MTFEKMIEKIIEQFVDYSGVQITSETVIRSIDEWDSLTGMAVQLMLKDEFNAQIPDEDFRNANTFGDLFELVKQYSS